VPDIDKGAAAAMDIKGHPINDGKSGSQKTINSLFGVGGLTIVHSAILRAFGFMTNNSYGCGSLFMPMKFV